MDDAGTQLAFLTQTADLIVKYGFLGLGLVLIVVIAPIVWSRSRLISYVALSSGLAFLITFGVLSIVQQYFPWLIISRDRMLFGIIREVPNGFQVQVRDDEWRVGQAYLKRENHPEKLTLFNEYFLLASVRNPTCLAVILDSTDPKSERQYLFNVEGIGAGDISLARELVLSVALAADGSIHLAGWRERDQRRIDPPLAIDARLPSQTLCGDGGDTPPSPVPRTTVGALSGISGASAQATGALGIGQPLDAGQLQAALKSDDAFVRRNGRSYLAQLGPQAAPLVEQFLSSDDYRLKLGGLAAVAQMPSQQRAQLPESLMAHIRTYTTDPDQATRDAALRALQQP